MGKPEAAALGSATRCRALARSRNSLIRSRHSPGPQNPAPQRELGRPPSGPGATHKPACDSPRPASPEEARLAPLLPVALLSVVLQVPVVLLSDVVLDARPVPPEDAQEALLLPVTLLSDLLLILRTLLIDVVLDARPAPPVAG